jgi:Na+/H+ antiporter NhaA
VNFRKAFDSIFHFVLMQKLQNLCISSDLWSWINDYLTDFSKFTVINRQELCTIQEIKTRCSSSIGIG